MEKEHPIHKLMDISLEHIVEMVDVSKIIGQPIMLDSKRFIIPISKVSFGFGAAGSEFEGNSKTQKKGKMFETEDNNFPFGGGSGGGVSISPFSFLVVDDGNISMIYAEKEETIVEKIIDLMLNKQNKDKS